MGEVSGMENLGHSPTVIACENCTGGATYGSAAVIGNRCPKCGGQLIEYVSIAAYRGAVALSAETAAVAATLVDLAKRNLPPHISESQQAEAYLALRRIAGGR